MVNRAAQREHSRELRSQMEQSSRIRDEQRAICMARIAKVEIDVSPDRDRTLKRHGPAVVDGAGIPYSVPP